MNKKILFGTGRIGEQACKFYGHENIECFVDNDQKKIGTIFQGKKVISIDELLKIYTKYDIYITSEYFGEIAEQLKCAGINTYNKYFYIDIKKVERYFSNIEMPKEYIIAIWGSDIYANAIYRLLPKNIKSKVQFYFQTDDENMLLDADEIKIVRKEEQKKIDAVIVTSPQYHLSDELKIKRLIGNIEIYNPYKMDTYYPQDQLVINKYLSAGNELLTEEKIYEKNRNRIDYFDAVKEYVREALIAKPLFHLIEIETINACNGNCSFCPVNKNIDPRKHEFMKSELFYKIIDQLEILKYDGRISLFSNNEPFLDNRILEFSQYTRKHLPNAKIHMFTNGTLLTLDKFLEIITFLDELIIDNYTDDLHLIKPVAIIKDYCSKHPELIKKVSIVLRKPNELLTSRGGDAPNRNVKQLFPDITCAFPFQQLIVRPTGQISLCCNDATGKYTMGDLSKDSIVDVWYGKQYSRVRELISLGRDKIGNCQYCDTFSLYL